VTDNVWRPGSRRFSVLERGSYPTKVVKMTKGRKGESLLASITEEFTRGEALGTKC